MKYNDDIALIRLNSRVEFNALIQPICLMTLNQNVNFGKVAGWGETDDYETISDIAKIVEFETIETFQCVLDNYLFGKFAWKDSFCAYSKTSGVCSGDSGSGFYVEIEGKTYLKGIVSSTVLKRCTENAIALYTDVTKYYKFIKVSK
jgi:secreted trypsin-like serine protease